MAVARWILDLARNCRDVHVSRIDIGAYGLPPATNAALRSGRDACEHLGTWSRTVASFDGFVFVTPETAVSSSATLTSAIDRERDPARGRPRRSRECRKQVTNASAHADRHHSRRTDPIANLEVARTAAPIRKKRGTDEPRPCRKRDLLRRLRRFGCVGRTSLVAWRRARTRPRRSAGR
jgi:hypothetical protein